jgi:uncharacterized protein YgiB involved in biofilm formation
MRTRTLVTTLFLGVAAIALADCSGCGKSDEAAVKIYPPDETGVAQCKSDHPEEAAQCDAALSGSLKEHEATAEHYTLQSCMEQYGASACQPRHNDSGESWFVPAMAGFMIGQMVGSSPVYHPVYVNLNGQAYYGRTAIGTYRPGSTTYVTLAPNTQFRQQYQTRTVTIPRTTPTGPPSYNYSAPGTSAAPRIERGGFGASSSTHAAPPSASSSPAPSSPSRGGFGGSSSSTTSSG